MAGGLFNPTDDDGRTAWDWARHLYDELCAIRESLTQDSQAPVSRIRVPFVIPTDSNGNGSVTLDLRPGSAWSLLTYAFQIPFPGVATGYVGFYRDVEEGTSLLKIDSAAALKDSQFNAEGHFIPEQSKLLIVARNTLASSSLSGNVSAKALMNAHPVTTTHSADL